MTEKLKIDKWLFSATAGLALFGVVMVYSASAVIAVQENHSQFHYVMKQGIWTLIGFGAMFVMMRFDYQLLNRAWIVYGLLLVTIVLLLAVFAFPAVNGARRWIKLSGFSMQPSELAKLSLAIFVAYFIQRRAGEEQSFWKTFLPCLFVLGIVAALVVKQPDLGTALMLAIIVFTMCYAGGVRARHMLYRDGAGTALRWQHADLHAVPHEAAGSIHGSVGRCAGHGLSGGAVADCRRVGWSEWTRIRAGPAETSVPAVRALRFYFRSYRRRVGTDRRLDRRDCFCDFPLARNARGFARAGSIRNVAGHRHRRGHCRAGAAEHKRRARTFADQRHSAAVHLLWWIFAGADAGSRGNPAEHFAVRADAAAERHTTTAITKKIGSRARSTRKKRPVRQRAVARAR